MDYEKLKAGKVLFELKQSNINQILSDLYELMKPIAFEKGSTFFITLPSQQ